MLQRRCCSFGNFHCQCVFLLVQSRWGQTTEKRFKQLPYAGLKESANWSIWGWDMNQSSDRAGRAIKWPKSYCAMFSQTNLTPTKSPACWGLCSQESARADSSWLLQPSVLYLNFYFRIKASGLTGELQQFLSLILSFHILTGPSSCPIHISCITRMWPKWSLVTLGSGGKRVQHFSHHRGHSTYDPCCFL